MNPRQVLLVDDNRDAADTLAEVLRLGGHDVRVAGAPSAALRILDTFDPDAIVKDVGVPECDGYRLAESLCQRHGQRPLLIAVTGYPRLTDQSRDEGFNHHFEKPVSPAAILPALTRPDP